MKVIVHDPDWGHGQTNGPGWIVHGLNPVLCPNCAGNAPGSPLPRVAPPSQPAPPQDGGTPNEGDPIVILPPPVRVEPM